MKQTIIQMPNGKYSYRWDKEWKEYLVCPVKKFGIWIWYKRPRIFVYRWWRYKVFNVRLNVGWRFRWNIFRQRLKFKLFKGMRPDSFREKMFWFMMKHGIIL